MSVQSPAACQLSVMEAIHKADLVIQTFDDISHLLHCIQGCAVHGLRRPSARASFQTSQTHIVYGLVVHLKRTDIFVQDTVENLVKDHLAQPEVGISSATCRKQEAGRAGL